MLPSEPNKLCRSGLEVRGGVRVSVSDVMVSKPSDTTLGYRYLVYEHDRALCNLWMSQQRTLLFCAGNEEDSDVLSSYALLFCGHVRVLNASRVNMETPSSTKLTYERTPLATTG